MVVSLIMSTYNSYLEKVRSRGWCFTINNYEPRDIERIKGIILNAKFGIAETEHTGEGEGTPHIQGYVYFENAQTFNRIKTMIGERAHIEAAKGNPEQNYDYCSKEGKVFVQIPMKKGEGKTNFIQMYIDMKTLPVDEFERLYPKEMYLRRDKVMQVMIQNAMDKVRDFNGNLPDKNWWVWGEPGVGKSRWAASNGEYAEIFKKNFNKWWDGYKILQTKIVIIEDYPPCPQGNVLAQHMKIWGDRYPFEGECKGSHMMIEPRRFFLIVTSNYPIDLCFQTEEDKQAIHRRFHEVKIEKGDLLSLCDFTLDRNILERNE